MRHAHCILLLEVYGYCVNGFAFTQRRKKTPQVENMRVFIPFQMLK